METAPITNRSCAFNAPLTGVSGMAHEISVALLTGGGDRPYVFGLATELISKRVIVDLIGSDDLDSPEFHGKSEIRFLNLRGDQNTNTSFARKAFRVLSYYARLIRYAATAEPKIFHILWNNKFQSFDRTLLMLYYKILGKKTVLTVHNVNTRKRDAKDSTLNRLTLRIQYQLADHIFVHTEQMKFELSNGFGVPYSRISVIPFGINNAVPNTCLSRAEARQRLGLRDGEKAILFFGNIAPYKGIEYLTSAFQKVKSQHDDYRLIIAGWPKNCDAYWVAVRESVSQEIKSGKVVVRAEYIPDSETEIYFKAADVLALPYKYIYQSGVLFLGYSFGLPVLAADVGSLKDEIVEGKTGFVFKPENPTDLATTIERYFASELFANLNDRRREIADLANEQHSWDVVGRITMGVYADLLRLPAAQNLSNREDARPSLVSKDPS
jgi:glycosyltransferase involved in cell wall biosynthesis